MRNTDVHKSVLISGTLRALIHWLKDNLLTEKPELFVQGDSV